MNDDTDTTFTINIDTDTIVTTDGVTPTFTSTLDLSNFTSGADNTVSVDDLVWVGNDNSWPSQYVIEEMVKKYPALKIQYEKFLEIYNLVKDDYKADDEIPF